MVTTGKKRLGVTNRRVAEMAATISVVTVTAGKKERTGGCRRGWEASAAKLLERKKNKTKQNKNESSR